MVLENGSSSFVELVRFVTRKPRFVCFPAFLAGAFWVPVDGRAFLTGWVSFCSLFDGGRPSPGGGAEVSAGLMTVPIPWGRTHPPFMGWRGAAFPRFFFAAVDFPLGVADVAFDVVGASDCSSETDSPPVADSAPSANSFAIGVPLGMKGMELGIPVDNTSVVSPGVGSLLVAEGDPSPVAEVLGIRVCTGMALLFCSGSKDASAALLTALRVRILIIAAAYLC